MGESAPSEVAEMDFGRLGLIDHPATGRRRVVWALIIVLTYSRHSFVWPTFSQKLVDVIEGLEAAWAFFEGVPKYLVIDNFPAAVAGVDPLHPRLTRGFLEYSQHRGFISDPARVRLHLRPGAGAASSQTRRGCAIPGTSRAWSVECPTCGSGSSRAGSSGVCRT